MKRVGIIRLVLLSLILSSFAQLSLPAAAPAGKVVWWGRDEFWKNNNPTDHTNGVIEFDDEIVSNVTAIAAGSGQGLLLRDGGTVFGIGRNPYPAGLANIIWISVQGNSCWAIRQDGSVVSWGSRVLNPHEFERKLTNVVAVYELNSGLYAALQSNGALFGLDLKPLEWGAPMTVGRAMVDSKPATDIIAIASMGDSRPIALNKSGEVFSLSIYTDPVTGNLSVTLVPIETNGVQLMGVTALASGGRHVLAVKKDGTVAAWGNNAYNAATVPPGLSNVVAVAAAQNESLALKHDGTVVAWGNNYFGQTSVPAGLSNVIAIASAGNFNFALTTGNIPASVYITPHGRLEMMERDADLVIKGKVLSSEPITNKAFPDWGAPAATKIAVISVLKGDPTTNEITFLHLTHGPMAWGGGKQPPHFALEDGASYLIFAKNTGAADYLYSPALNPTSGGNEFRQLMQKGEVPIRTLDDRPLDTKSVRETHWRELNLLLNSSDATNQLYAIEKLDALSLSHRGEREWDHSEDFRRTNVLKALVPLVLSTNAQVARRAVDCFGVNKDSTKLLEPFTSSLIEVANGNSSEDMRTRAIAALSGTHFGAISNSLAALLHDASDKIRSRAIALLRLYPGDFTAQELRRGATDEAPQVRAGVADVIGYLKEADLLPTLARLFMDPVGRDKPVPPLTMEGLEGGGYIVSVNEGTIMVDDPNYSGAHVGDVHTSSGYALLKFDVEQVAEVLKTNLNDPGFRLQFILKLADTNAGPWLDDLTAIMEKRHERNMKKAQALNAPLNSYNSLSDAYFRCWKLIYSYLEKQPATEYQLPKNGGGKFGRYLDMLEQAGTTGSQEPVSLYHLYRVKGLTERAARMRQKYPDYKQYFDNSDQQP